MKTFIRVAELWLPNRDRSRLEFGGGLYGKLTNFRAASEGMHFAFDEGLPGKAWAAGRPIILKEFENSYFKRTDAAKAAGLTCGVALPVFAGEFLMAVVVFFCGDDEARVGAIELWTNGPDEAHFMSLADGYYGAAEMFEFNSRYTKFPVATGCPAASGRKRCRCWSRTCSTRDRSCGGKRPSRSGSIAASGFLIGLRRGRYGS